MRSVIVAALIVTGLSATAARAQEAATPKTAKQGDAGKRICRADTSTGSRMARKTCHTEAEWAEISRQNTEAANTAVQGRSSGR